MPFSSTRFYHSRPEWTWEQWQWRGALHSPKPQHHWNLTIKLFRVINQTLVRGCLTPLHRCSRRILQPQPMGQWLCWGDSILPTAPELEQHQWMLFSAMPRTHFFKGLVPMHEIAVRSFSWVISFNKYIWCIFCSE